MLKDTTSEMHNILDQVRNSHWSSWIMKRTCEILKDIAEERNDFHLSETVP